MNKNCLFFDEILCYICVIFVSVETICLRKELAVATYLIANVFLIVCLL